MATTQSNPPTSTPKYVPPHRRHDVTPPSQRYLNYEDLHARYSPPSSPPLRMPRVQRSLSIEDLRHRFKREQGGSQGQDLPGSPPPPPSHDQDSPGSPPPPPSHDQDSPGPPPPPLPRDFEALRAHGHGQRSPFGHSQSPPPLQRPFLSPRFPDPPIFNGSGTSILFEDWKLRIRDKLIVNKDHYPSEYSQIAYIITRLGGKAIEHTLRKRRTNSYHSADQLLSQLTDIYEPTLEVIDDVNRDTFYALKQGDRPFPEFYSDFMKHAPGSFFDDDKQMVWRLREKLNYDLQMGLADCGKKDWSLPELRDHVMQLDYCLRTVAARKAKKKAERFTKQLAIASMEAESRKPGKYAIMPPSDPEEFRR